MKVLFATDGSERAGIALQTAHRLLASADLQLDLLCVAPTHRHRKNGGAHEQRMLRQAARILDRTRSGLPPDAGVNSLIADVGSPSLGIVNRTEDYDLTVIGSRGRGASDETGLGPVASRVLEHAHGAVLVARELRSEESLQVLVALDGSAASVHALETLSSLFDLSSGDICLMHVAETPWVEWGLEQDWVTYSDEEKAQSEAGTLEKELAREGEGIIRHARDLLMTKHASVTARIEEGNPANEILCEAERGEYDLVVVGATGARDLKHRMLGSVSSKIAWNAPCSVLIVRRPE